MRTLLLAGVVVVVVVAIGGFFGWRAFADAQEKAAQAKIAQEKDDTWKAALDKVSGKAGVTVTDGTITFHSARKADCNADDYPKYDPWLGQVTDWDALKVCRAQADLTFATNVIATTTNVDAFTTIVGIPPSFKTRLGSLRGLDGTQESDFPDSKAGLLHVTYSYDGGNGVFVQVERK